MVELNVALVAAGGLVLGLGLFSSYIHRHIWATEPLVALAAGVLLGPVTGVIVPGRWGPEPVILEQSARLTLAIGLMAVALRIPPGFLRSQWRSAAVLLGLLMPLMWISTGLLIHVTLDLPLLPALLLGAILTPTDPIVSTSIVTGHLAERVLPARLRHALSVESGANDGLASLMVLLIVALLLGPTDAAIGWWLTRAVLIDVGGAILFGAGVGYVAGRLLAWGDRRRMLERTSFLAYSVALSLLTLGAADLIGVQGVLAVFVAGVAFAAVASGHERAEEEGVQEAVSQFFTLPVFALIGLVVPWEEWIALGWRGAAMAGLILALRRLPALLALARWLPVVRTRRDALFLGWFGPLGVAALYYAELALRHTGREEIWVVASLAISASIVAHGVTATPLTRLYGARR
jgi:sodium/hydrogen antiporter